MSKFKYVAKTKDGKTMRGYVEAPGQNGAIQSLRAKGLIIISLEKESGGFPFLPDLSNLRKGKIKIDDFVVFSRQLATMVNAGIPLVNALDILAEQMEHPRFKQIVGKIHDDVETGSSFSEALTKHTGLFSELFVNMVRAGETSGMLDEILDRLATYLEKTSNLQKKVKSALVYPATVTIMAVGITTFLLLKVIPVFKDIYSGFGAKLPLPTQIIMTISDYVRHYFYLAIGVLCAMLFFMNRYAKSERGKTLLDSFKLNVPIFGILVRKMAIAKFARTLSTLIKSGVPILGALDIVGKTSGNRIIEMAVGNVRTNVKEGEPIADPLLRSGVFPSMVVRMISVGEQTGELEKMLTKIADFYDNQVDAAVGGLTSLIEPLIIAFLGIVIGGIVVCMFLPILKISTVLTG